MHKEGGNDDDDGGDDNGDDDDDENCNYACESEDFFSAQTPCFKHLSLCCQDCLDAKTEEVCVCKSARKTSAL